MDKVLVFTNINSGVLGLPAIMKKVRENKDWKYSYPNENSPIAICVENQGASATLRPINDFSEEGIYLVYDEIDNYLLDNLLKECKHNNDRLCVLIHSRGDYNDLNYFNVRNNIYTLRGIHEQERIHFYEPVFDIIIDKDDNKLARVINSIFMPEVIKGFLHECLVPNNKNLLNTPSYHFLYQGDFKGALESFMKRYESSNSLEEYKADLAILRDTLMTGCNK